MTVVDLVKKGFMDNIVKKVSVSVDIINTILIYIRIYVCMY